MTRRVLLLAALAFVALAAVCVGVRRSEWWTVDRCLDAGGRWNAEARTCEGAG